MVQHMPALTRLECRRRAIKKSQATAEPLEGEFSIPDIPQARVEHYSVTEKLILSFNFKVRILTG